ncbi:MAG: dethiobiotin synthase [Pseudomonadales bacterium]|nr:dethiobiotin synthase [Pseudomonadales bacterium]
MKAPVSYFVTGTDTDVGKTRIACGILEYARQRGLSSAAVKPMAAGCEQTADGFQNEDALELMDAMTLSLPYSQVNPIALEPAIAPHIAAEQVGVEVSAEQLTEYCRKILNLESGITLVEGAGGWRVPINRTETFADVAKMLNLPVILVVSMRLGCINHAMLSLEAIRADGLSVAGWVANRVDAEMSCYQENLETLKRQIPEPCLGIVPHLEDPTGKEIAGCLNIETL